MHGAERRTAAASMNVTAADRGVLLLIVLVVGVLRDDGGGARVALVGLEGQHSSGLHVTPPGLPARFP